MTSVSSNTFDWAIIVGHFIFIEWIGFWIEKFERIENGCFSISTD